ncbi:hypothetical protein [Limnohabitans sp. Rim8]|uniref:hypothetical protein n=1 Tax=Limnohabitans sp. Rim8 TaxID=1100718 RepID=UPI0026015B86|nr:hypothetical protein [Limnohabitans sp. Rim8]
MTQKLLQKDIDELFLKSKEDGSRLYATADSLHKLFQKLLIFVGAIGVIIGFIAMEKMTFFAGVIIITITLAICFLIYMLQIIVTNSSKVLVHILFTNLAILEKEKQ